MPICISHSLLSTGNKKKKWKSISESFYPLFKIFFKDLFPNDEGKYLKFSKGKKTKLSTFVLLHGIFSAFRVADTRSSLGYIYRWTKGH